MTIVEKAAAWDRLKNGLQEALDDPEGHEVVKIISREILSVMESEEK